MRDVISIKHIMRTMATRWIFSRFGIPCPIDVVSSKNYFNYKGIYIHCDLFVNEI